MIEKLFAYYKQQLTFRGVIIRENGFFKNFVFHMFLVFFVISWCAFFIAQNYIFAIGAIFSLVISVVIGRLSNASTILRKYPQYYSTKFSWSTEGLDKLYLERLGNYIKENNFDEKKLDKIQELIKVRVQQEKLPSIFIFTVFGALFIPLWSTTLSAFLNEFQGEFQGDLSQIWIVFILLLTFVSIVPFICYMLLQVHDTVISDYAEWIRLNSLISVTD